MSSYNAQRISPSSDGRRRALSAVLVLVCGATCYPLMSIGFWRSRENMVELLSETADWGELEAELEAADYAWPISTNGFVRKKEVLQALRALWGSSFFDERYKITAWRGQSCCRLCDTRCGHRTLETEHGVSITEGFFHYVCAHNVEPTAPEMAYLSYPSQETAEALEQAAAHLCPQLRARLQAHIAQLRERDEQRWEREAAEQRAAATAAAEEEAAARARLNQWRASPAGNGVTECPICEEPLPGGAGLRIDRHLMRCFKKPQEATCKRTREEQREE